MAVRIEVNDTKFIDINTLPMYHDESDGVLTFDFDELAAHLLDQGALASPSRMHGFLCGLLSAGAPDQAEYGVDALAESLDLVAHGELVDCAMQLYTASAVMLRDEEFTFFPLLPHDEVDIELRAVALADWCDGFLAGVAHMAAAKEKFGRTVTRQSSEALQDISVLALAEAGADEHGEEAEESYFELVEYLRVAVLNIYMDNGGDHGEPEPAGEEDPLY